MSKFRFSRARVGAKFGNGIAMSKFGFSRARVKRGGGGACGDDSVGSGGSGVIGGVAGGDGGGERDGIGDVVLLTGIFAISSSLSSSTPSEKIDMVESES